MLENGKPPSSNSGLIGMEQSFPSFLTSKNLESSINRNDTRLRIFSGTANPALAQVI